MRRNAVTVVVERNNISVSVQMKGINILIRQGGLVGLVQELINMDESHRHTDRLCTHTHF